MTERATNWNTRCSRSIKDLKQRLVFWAKQLLCTCITLFSTFLWRPLQDYDVKPPNGTFCGGRGHTTTNFSFSNWTCIKALKNSTPGKVAYIWRIERVPNRRDEVWKDANSFLVMFPLLSLSSLLKDWGRSPLKSHWYRKRPLISSPTCKPTPPPLSPNYSSVYL